MAPEDLVIANKRKNNKYDDFESSDTQITARINIDSLRWNLLY